MLKLFSFTCTSCGFTYEDLIEDGDQVPCPECGEPNDRDRIQMPGIAKFSIAGAEAQKEMLKQRSKEHTRKEVAKEPERFGFKK